MTPDETAEDGCAPGKVVPRDGEGEQCSGSGWGDEAEKTENGGEQYTSPDRAEGNVAEALGDGTEERREGERAIAGEGPGLAGYRNEDGQAHEELDNEEERHESQGSVFADRVVVDLGHGLSEGGTKDGFKVRVDSCGDHDHDDESEKPAGCDRHHDAVRYGLGSVGSFLGHVDTGVESADCPDRRQPGEHEGPSRRPGGEVLGLREDVMSIVAFGGEMLTDR